LVTAPPNNPFPAQLYRAVRTTVHVAAGIATTTFVFPWLDVPRRRTRVKRWSVKLLRILGVETDVRGHLHEDAVNVLVVANHVSWLDIFVLNSILPVRFVAKAELGDWPLASNLIRGAGTVFISRESRRDTHRVNSHVAQVLAGGDVVAIFPEGTTTDGTTMLPFRSSLLQAIVEAQGHVQPIALRFRTPDGALSRVPAYVGETTFAESFWRVCGERRLHVEVVALPALPARDRHRRDLTRAAEHAIRAVLDAPAPARAPGTRADRAGAHR
jgi:1-acyl-sn-glycerol-3-phosphate acyltransferase